MAKISPPAPPKDLPELIAKRTGQAGSEVIEVGPEIYEGDDWEPYLQRYAGVTRYRYVRFLQGLQPYRGDSGLSSCDQWLADACQAAANPSNCGQEASSRANGPCTVTRGLEQIAVKDGIVHVVTEAARKPQAMALMKALFPSFQKWEHAYLAARIYFMHTGPNRPGITLRRRPGHWLITGFVGGSFPGVNFDIKLELYDDGRIVDSTKEKQLPGMMVGRRPVGLVGRKSQADSDLGRYFAETAHMEAASVSSFERLADELTTFGAPSVLVKRARAAVKDERRHARVMGALRSRFGAKELPLRIRKTAARSFYAFAKENAIEGCIFETYAALEAHHASRASSDVEVRKTHASIAKDETRHAELAWDISVWARTQLTMAQRRQLATAQGKALGKLRAGLRSPKSPALHEVAGVPVSRVALALCDAFFSQH